jgi:hypothetical protein
MITRRPCSVLQGMQAQNMMWGPAFVTIGMFVANIFVNLGLIKLYGFTGAAYAQSVSRVALLLFLIGSSPLPRWIPNVVANASHGHCSFSFHLVSPADQGLQFSHCTG